MFEVFIGDLSDLVLYNGCFDIIIEIYDIIFDERFDFVFFGEIKYFDVI